MDDMKSVAIKEERQALTPNQNYLLSIQLSQHIQLAVQQFITTYKHPSWHQLSTICKENLLNLCNLKRIPNLQITLLNLPDALKLVNDWEYKLTDTKFLGEYIAWIKKESEQEKIYQANRRKYKSKFHPELIKIMLESKALMHSHLLPEIFPYYFSYKQNAYLPSEEKLIALGLEQFMPYCDSQVKFSRKLADVSKDIQKYLVPRPPSNGLMCYIKKRKASKENNPIKQYFSTGCSPKLEHFLMDEYKLLSPKNQPIELLPNNWQTYVKNEQNNDYESVNNKRSTAVFNDLRILFNRDYNYSQSNYSLTRP